MNRVHCAAILALLSTSTLFATEPRDDARTAGKKQSPPSYVIQPADVIYFEILKVVLKSPHKAEVSDGLEIRVANALHDQPINNYSLVGVDGTINLGSTYGSVHVAGMTIDEIRTALVKWLRKWVKDPSITVELARVPRIESLAGLCLVASDGTIRLIEHDSIKVGGKTIAEVRATVQDHLKQALDASEVCVNVTAYDARICHTNAQDEPETFTALVQKATAPEPAERVSGKMGDGLTIIPSKQTMGRNYNRNRNGL